jgi:putative transposase
MPRTARVAPGDTVYHILMRGNKRQSIFKEDDDYHRFLELLLKYKEKLAFKLYHYALMTTHVHLVLDPTSGGNLAEIMKDVNLSYAQYYKGNYKHIGYFWQDRYKTS